MSDTEVQPTPETGAGNDDVRAIVAAAYEKHSAPEPEAQPDIQAETPAETEQRAERARNERGQFAKAEAEKPLAEPNSDADPGQDKPETPSPAIEPPKSWSADAKSEWSKLSPALQQAVIKREREIDEGGRRWSEEKRTYEDMLAPVRQQAQRSGISEREGLQRLLYASEFLERDPASAIKWLAQNYGVNLSGTDDTQQAASSDPRVMQLHQEVTSIRSVLEQRDRLEAQNDIQRFASDPANEHFEAVKGTMGDLIAKGLATDLKDAYEKATWMNPEVRQRIIDGQASKAEAERKARERDTAERARRAAVSINGSPAGAGAPIARPEYKTVEDAVRAAYQQHAR